MTAPWEVGQRVFVHRPGNRREPGYEGWVTVEKVGRKWLYVSRPDGSSFPYYMLSNNRFDIVTGWSDRYDLRMWPSVDEFQRAQVAKDKLAVIDEWRRSHGRRLTVEQTEGLYRALIDLGIIVVPETP